MPSEVFTFLPRVMTATRGYETCLGVVYGMYCLGGMSTVNTNSSVQRETTIGGSTLHSITAIDAVEHPAKGLLWQEDLNREEYAVNSCSLV